MRLTAESASGSTAQRVLADAKAALEHVATPQPEAKERVERIMKGADPFALWAALGENRWNRRRKLLPKLRLTCPSDDELRRVAEFAEVNDPSSFGEHIRSIILDAHLNDQMLRTLSIPQIRKALNQVVSQAKRLDTILSTLDLGRGSIGSLNYAGRLIEIELAAFQRFKVGGMILLPEYISLLDVLSNAAQRAARRAIHEPKGAGGNPAFDIFIQNLVMAARQRGGSWTNYRAADGTWNGTLLNALELLRKYLPRKFFPTGQLGRSVEHIRTKLTKHMKAFRPPESAR